MLSCFHYVRLFATCGPYPIKLLHLWVFPGKNTGVDGHFHLQGIFSTHGSNKHLLCLLHWQAGFFTTSAIWEAIIYQLHLNKAVKGVSLVAQKLKNMPAMQKSWVRSLGQEDPLEKGMATHSIFDWRISWTEQPGRLQSMESQSWTQMNN